MFCAPTSASERAERKASKRLRKELGAAYDNSVAPATREQLVLGRQVYQTFCLNCHGYEGKGRGPASVALKDKPADFTDFAHATL